MLEKLGIKRLIIIVITCILIFIVIFGGALLYNKLLYSKTHTEVENIMAEAAEDYYEDNTDKLPKMINDTITVNVDTLIKNNYMKELDTYLKNSSCSGSVSVTNINSEIYRYTPTLDCGNDYQTKSLMEYVNDNVDIVTSSDGLYDMNGTLVYRGSNVNNYLKLSGRMYRIIKFVDGHAVVILNEEIESTDWDSNYNETTDDRSGINNYKTSDIKYFLENIYKNDSEKALLKNNDKTLVTSYDLKIGKRCNADKDKSGDLEKAIVLENQYIGLISTDDFLNASLSEFCTNTNNESCGNFNYLAKYRKKWWTVTANSKNTYKAYLVADGKLISTPANETAYIRPVFYLATDAIYIAGNGSKDEPFEIK